jgi:lipopolysaccharide/colanic/teichoic acid biosynthesis glycosyltransferase
VASITGQLFRWRVSILPYEQCVRRVDPSSDGLRKRMFSGHVFPGRPSARSIAAPFGYAGAEAASRGVPYDSIKRIIDVISACCLLLVLSPVLVAVGLAILLTMGGPVLFRQRRIGLYGQEIYVWKFRTMCADRRAANLGPPRERTERRVRHKTRRDPRVTPLGRFLRRASLDELPQLWNVVKGDMSMVGPRPELPQIVARYEEWQHARHLVRPGITGWWQVNRPADRLMCEVVELDVFYVEHRSLWLDLTIVVRTVSAVLRGTGAF